MHFRSVVFEGVRLALMLGVSTAVAVAAPPENAPENGAFCRPEDIQDGVKRAQRMVSWCYERDLVGGRAFEGKFTAIFRIGPGGRVGKVAIARVLPDDTAFRECVAHALQATRFASPAGGTCQVTYPFVFQLDPRVPDPPPVGAVARVDALEVAAPGSVQRFEAIRHRLAVTELRDDAEKQSRLSLIRDLIEDELLRQHASTRGIRVKPVEVEAEVSRLRARFPSEEAFGAFAQRVSGGVPQLREGLRFRLTVDALYRKLGHLPFTTIQRDATWSAFRDRWARPERVVADHLLLALPQDATEAEVADARTRIEALRAELSKPGADFAAIARANSEAPSAAEGGALGDVLRGRTPPAFEKAAFELPIGVLSEPVRSTAGFHLIRVHRRDPARVADLTELDRESPRLLPALHRRWVRSALVTTLAARARIEALTPDAQAVVPLLGTIPWLVPDDLGPDAPDWPFHLAP